MLLARRLARERVKTNPAKIFDIRLGPGVSKPLLGRVGLRQEITTDEPRWRVHQPRAGDEGMGEILTMARALEYLSSDGDASAPDGEDAAHLLAAELMNADAISFIVGQTVNPYYQNPQLPKAVSIRRSLVEQLAALLRARQKHVYLELC